MASHDIIVIGTSAGGVDALSQLVRGLPPGLPAALFVVCHFPAGGISVLPEILSRNGPLLAHHAVDGEPIYPGQIYVAPPDYHLLLPSGGRVHLSHGPREHHVRPAIDPLFRSAARVYGPRVIGVVLTGSLYDGVAGLLAVRAAGGIAVVQDPHDAAVASMPQTAYQLAGADHVAPVAGLGTLLGRLVSQPVETKGGSDVIDPLERLPETMAADAAAQAHNGRRGAISVLTCPDCGGVLWQVDQNQLVRFRCHTGHTYHGEDLLAEQSTVLEAALWSAVRMFKEKRVLAEQLADQARRQQKPAFAERLAEEARQADRYGALLQQLVVQGPDALDSRGQPPDMSFGSPAVQDS